MEAAELFSIWRRFKSRVASWRLDERCSKELEFKGVSCGPSTYAYVRFECCPADTLSFEMGTSWPGHLGPDYRRLLEQAMTAAIVDTLLAGSECPYLGCSLKCVQVGWDDVGSSEVTFYSATRGAVSKLREEERWISIGRRNVI